MQQNTSTNRRANRESYMHSFCMCVRMEDTSMRVCTTCLYAWMDGYIDGSMDGWTDGWMDGCMHACRQVRPPGCYPSTDNAASPPSA